MRGIFGTLAATALLSGCFDLFEERPVPVDFQVPEIRGGDWARYEFQEDGMRVTFNVSVQNRTILERHGAWIPGHVVQIDVEAESDADVAAGQVRLKQDLDPLRAFDPCGELQWAQDAPESVAFHGYPDFSFPHKIQRVVDTFIALAGTHFEVTPTHSKMGVVRIRENGLSLDSPSRPEIEGAQYDAASPFPTVVSEPALERLEVGPGGEPLPSCDDFVAPSVATVEPHRIPFDDRGIHPAESSFNMTDRAATLLADDSFENLKAFKASVNRTQVTGFRYEVGPEGAWFLANVSFGSGSTPNRISVVCGADGTCRDTPFVGFTRPPDLHADSKTGEGPGQVISPAVALQRFSGTFGSDATALDYQVGWGYRTYGWTIRAENGSQRVSMEGYLGHIGSVEGIGAAAHP